MCWMTKSLQILPDNTHMHAPQIKQNKQYNREQWAQWGITSKHAPRSPLSLETPDLVYQCAQERWHRCHPYFDYKIRGVSPKPMVCNCLAVLGKKVSLHPVTTQLKVLSDHSWPLSTPKEHKKCCIVYATESCPSHSCAWLIKPAWKPRLSLHWLFLLLNQKTPL